MSTTGSLEIEIDKFINKLTDCLSVAHAYVVGFDVLDIGQAALLEIR